MDLPADGILNCTTISVAAGVTLGFNRNPLNTPVYLLATGDVKIAGTVSVSGSAPAGNIPGKGEPGGFDGGYGGYGIGATSRGSDGFGPGAGHDVYAGQHAIYGAAGFGNTNVYGNALLVPLVGGSGGAGSDGNPGGYGDGGGGGIRIVTPLVKGAGRLQAYSAYAGPSGRIRIDCTDRYAFRSLFTSAATVTRGAEMYVFPAVVTRLDIISAAGQTIPEGTASEVTVQLSAGASTNQW